MSFLLQSKGTKWRTGVNCWLQGPKLTQAKIHIMLNPLYITFYMIIKVSRYSVNIWSKSGINTTDQLCPQSYTCSALVTNITAASPVPVCLVSGGDHEGLPAPERGADVPQRSGGGGTLGNHGVPAGRRSHPHRQWNQVSRESDTSAGLVGLSRF